MMLVDIFHVSLAYTAVGMTIEEYKHSLTLFEMEDDAHSGLRLRNTGIIPQINKSWPLCLQE